MKAHEIISALDNARSGHRRLNEDTAPVAAPPSHAPTSTAQWKTKSTGKSEDEGSRTGGEKDAIKKSDTAIPAPVAKSPSHAPTSTAQWKTSGEGHSGDEGEKISKEAMKEELLNQLANGDEDDIAAVLAQIAEGGHKPGCQCGFCKNKGKFGKKSTEDEKDEKDEPVSEGHLPITRKPSHHGRPPTFGSGKHDWDLKPAGLLAYQEPPIDNNRPPFKRRLGGERMGFRHPSAARPRPKAASLPGGSINPNQPAMERLDSSYNPRKTIQDMADELLMSPEDE